MDTDRIQAKIEALRRCSYCPDGATHTVISASGKQIDTCLADARTAIDGLLMPPRVLSLAHEPEEAVIIDWSWPPLDRHHTAEALEAVNHLRD